MTEGWPQWERAGGTPPWPRGYAHTLQAHTQELLLQEYHSPALSNLELRDFWTWSAHLYVKALKALPPLRVINLLAI